MLTLEDSRLPVCDGFVPRGPVYSTESDVKSNKSHPGFCADTMIASVLLAVHAECAVLAKRLSTESAVSADALCNQK